MSLPALLLWNHYPSNLNPTKAHDMPSHIARRLTTTASQIILGKEHAVRLALACILARGHLLIEDIPGVGPTRRRKLLAAFGGLDGVRDATVEDLCRVDGINRHLAEQIYNALR